MSNKKDYVKEVLVTHEEIVAYCKILAQTIEEQYQDRSLTILGTLKGSVPFLAELAKHFTRDDINFEYIRASSYEGKAMETTGDVQITAATFASLAGQNVIILEDIIDTGLTVRALYEYLQNHGAQSIQMATLLDKPERRLVQVEADFVGFSIPNYFVVGFGLDYNEKYRNLMDVVIPYPDKL